MKKIALLFVLAIANVCFAQTRIDMGDGLTITIPAEFQADTSQLNKGEIYVGHNGKGISLMIGRPMDGHGFSGKEFMAKGDKNFFPVLSVFNKIRQKDEGKFNVSRDYLIKYYDQGKKGTKIATFSSYVYQFPYAILFAYSSDSDLEKLDEIIESVDYNSTWWHETVTLFNYSGGILILAMLAIMIISSLLQNWKIGCAIGIVLGGIVLFPVCSHPGVFITYLVGYALLGYIFSHFTLVQLLKGFIENL